MVLIGFKRRYLPVGELDVAFGGVDLEHGEEETDKLLVNHGKHHAFLLETQALEPILSCLQLLNIKKTNHPLE
jgi:hypothetical protein